MASTATTLRNRHGGSHRFASVGLRRSETVVDYQANMDELATQNAREAAAIAREIEVDLADDKRRFDQYVVVERAIRHGDRDAQLRAFHALVSHIEADEAREDARRLTRKAARELHAARIRALRTIFHDDFVTPYLEADA